MDYVKKIKTFIIAVFDFITKYFKTCVFLSILALILFSSSEPVQTPNLAKIYIKGAILDSENLRLQIEEVRKYPTIKGALLIIDSPGGGVGPSVEMADMIANLAKEMPVVAHIENMMASGGYYAGIYATKIYANRGSLIGSIGVILNGANIEELMQKIGVKSQILSVGEFKEAGSFMREWSEKEKDYLREIINETYEMFVSDVRKARKLESMDSDIFAQGRIFNAPKAHKIGLIDEIGSRDDAILALQELSGVKQTKWLERSKFETYMQSLMQSFASQIVSAFGLQLQ